MKEKNWCYLVCSVKDDLPVAVCDTFLEVQNFLCCSSHTVAKSIKYKTPYKNLYVEKVLL